MTTTPPPAPLDQPGHDAAAADWRRSYFRALQDGKDQGHEIARLRGVILSFAKHAEDSGWPHTAAELRGLVKPAGGALAAKEAEAPPYEAREREIFDRFHLIAKGAARAAKVLEGAITGKGQPLGVVDLGAARSALNVLAQQGIHGDAWATEIEGG